jgi:phage gp37-like protein
MLADAENALVARIKASPIGSKLRAVDTLPDLEDDSLVKHFANDAPACYVAPSPMFKIEDGVMQVSFGVACVARNAAGQAATRKGDGKIVGLYELAEYIASLLNGFNAGEIPLYVSSIALMSDASIFKAGLQVATVRLEGSVMLSPTIDEASLADFLTMNSQYDIEPFAGGEEHAKWKKEPPDHSTSAPVLTDQAQVQQ